ncbi:uncharacterized protein LOC120187716 [Hibiscus syriacus]|uniref:uncharacterized protein LOC120187716 n=1 Tax=Hibiscus syriacus TaxID=106335 RepID=UPI00192293CC|nr:uncharacterized protein LOC120187716 [Hibiscus syriacus]
MGEKWAADRIQKKGESDCFLWSCLKELIVKHSDIEKSMEMFALGIYGLVIFLKVICHVESVVVDLFERLERKVNHVPEILAKTFRSLKTCKRPESSRFAGCVQLLTVWMRSHFWKIDREYNRRLSTTYSPLEYFITKEWHEHLTRKYWVSLLRNLQDHDIVWQIPWLAFVKILYKCGESNWVNLLGLWGGVCYAPLMVLRQFGARQFVPATSGLSKSEFVYHIDHYKKITRLMLDAWKSTFRADVVAAKVMLTPDYVVWRAVRKNDVIPLADHDQVIPVEAQFRYVPFEFEILKSEYETENARKEAECEALWKENFMLDLDSGFYRKQFELMRKRKDNVEVDFTDFQKDCRKMNRA